MKHEIEKINEHMLQWSLNAKCHIKAIKTHHPVKMDKKILPGSTICSKKKKDIYEALTELVNVYSKVLPKNQTELNLF